jgi:leader peptidase (prepilin peptidase) / N-methyltransferase
METLTLVFVAVAGLVFGSFFNVVIYRLPRGLNLSKPPSACPGCGARIKPYDNVPVLSYILLGGRCRRCHRRISPVYPAVELLTALGFVLVYLHAGRQLGLEFFAGCVFTSALIVLGFIDAGHQILPDAVTMPGLALALAYSFFRGDLTFRGALIGAVVGAGFLLLVYGAYRLVRRKEGLGMGDVTMMLMVGAYLGWARTLFVLILASLAGAAFGVYLIARKGKDFQFALPFGTFIAPAAFVAMIWGRQVVDWYVARLPR